MNACKDKHLLSNGLFFFERCSLITATVCAYKLTNASKLSRYDDLFAHTVAYYYYSLLSSSFEKSKWYAIPVTELR